MAPSSERSPWRARALRAAFTGLLGVVALASCNPGAGTGEVRVDNPTQNLESYFLEVVEKAKQGQQLFCAFTGVTAQAMTKLILSASFSPWWT